MACLKKDVAGATAVVIGGGDCGAVTRVCSITAAGDWSEADAHAWWAGSTGVNRSSRSPRAKTRTITVDLEHRASAPRARPIDQGNASACWPTKLGSPPFITNLREPYLARGGASARRPGHRGHSGLHVAVPSASSWISVTSPPLSIS